MARFVLAAAKLLSRLLSYEPQAMAEVMDLFFLDTVYPNRGVYSGFYFVA